MSNLARVKRASGRCCDMEIGGGRGAIQISASVGRGGRNKSDDVRTIQEALNALGPSRGGPIPLLVVDGFIGPKTIGAIERFQRQQCGFKWPDGRVDPGQRTITRLNELLGGADAAARTGTGGAASPTPTGVEGLVARMIPLVPETLRCVRAAETNLQLARSVINEPKGYSPRIGDTRAMRMHLINLHLRLDDLPNKAAVLEELIVIFFRMRTVFQRPGNLWGAFAIQPDPFFANPKHKDFYAYTYYGGYFRPGETTSKKQRKDAVYLSNVLVNSTKDLFIQTLVHELAHFVGERSGWKRITDHAYGWVEDPDMKKLKASRRIFNAESLANFAFHVRYGRRWT